MKMRMCGESAPKVSIVIPTFQEEKYIGRLLSKIVAINPHLEVIVVDGGSTDKTVDVARIFTERVYVLRERGIGKARNYGARKASGDIIIFMDADVDPQPDFVGKVVSAFKRYHIVGLTCNIMPKDPLPHEQAFFKLYNFLLFILSFFKPHSRGVFFAVKRDIFLKIGGFNERLPCGEDHEIAFRLSKVGRIIFLRDLTIYESMRRFRIMGFFKVLRLWARDYIFLLLFNRVISKSWEPAR
ncbi:glycosyltransferase [Candidatus Bathyarchaeota archaeon]|nr:glycosyltransferase [Candidatus Bathyarchaeota archaeon]